ncbi:hypothetical protein [Methylobacterium sp. J-070]|uniref:hypothetical protein n=1 Tax=Methylobacterium sp. J-070 TaxID=2836650 RepID=UPI001FB9019E|nr:hypothetical protein [Methylobacterium sp. J-070]MCJ2049371.1 hypothetical protein [Methylobacterium sp. J-070]
MARKQPDPIFAAIAAHREAHEEFRVEASFLWPKRGRSKCAAEYDAARKAYETATEKLVVTEVQTLAGVHAFAAYLSNLQCCGRSDIAPGVYSVETWDLSAGMDRIAKCLARLAAAKPARGPKAVGPAEPLPIAA